MLKGFNVDGAVTDVIALVSERGGSLGVSHNGAN